jgi:hypothetical protein
LRPRLITWIVTADWKPEAGSRIKSPALGPYLLILLLSAFPSFSSGPQDPVRDALRLRDRGQFARAVELLEDRLRQDPDDAEAVRLRAETL